MSRPQFQSKAATLAELAMVLLAHDCPAGEFFTAVEQYWPWLKQSENWHEHRNGRHTFWSFSRVTGAYMAWVVAGRPIECPSLIDDLRDGLGGIRSGLADEVIRDRDDQERGKFLGKRSAHRGSPGRRAGEKEVDVTYSCGCSGGLKWMRVDAHGNLRDEEVAILAAEEYYHQCA